MHFFAFYSFRFAIQSCDVLTCGGTSVIKPSSVSTQIAPLRLLGLLVSFVRAQLQALKPLILVAPSLRRA
jgi:hypothetical protein